jgi:hypothetical protein
MVPVISKRRWTQWCACEHLPVADAAFALDTCYYGVGLHSRPGTLLLNLSVLIHSSYSWHQTLWALGESRLRVEIQLSDIVNVQRYRISPWLRLIQLYPDSHFRVVERSGQVHNLVLQRAGRDFAAALTSIGIELTDEAPNA